MSSNKKEIFRTEVQTCAGLQSIVSFLQPLFGNKTCVLLKGGLAAGKTTLVQKFCDVYALPLVSSPTFSIHQVYANQKITVDHFDLYRLRSTDEIETSGLWDVFAKSSALVFIEWSERLSPVDLPRDWKTFEIEIVKKNDEQRTVVIYSFE